MRRSAAIAALACALLASACAGAGASGDVASAAGACNRGASHVEVEDTGTVTRVLGVRRGASGSHEGFIVAFSRERAKVESNIDITGYIPLRSGDTVRLRGQFECNDGVIHWTHRDPRMRHEPGYVEVNGKRYQ